MDALVEVTRQLQTPRRTPFAGERLARSQLEALFVLAHRDTVTPSLLAATLRVTVGAVTQLVTGLRERDLVTQHPHPDDARSVVLALTPQAVEEIGRFEVAFLDAVAPRFDALPDDRIRDLAALLDAITEKP